MILNEKCQINESSDVVFEIVNVDKFIDAFKKDAEMNEDFDKLDAKHKALVRAALGNNRFSKVPTKQEINRQNKEFKIPPELVGIGLALAQQFGIRRKDK